MSKLLTLGVLLTAKDMISPIIGKTVNKFNEFNNKAKELQKSMENFDRTSLKTTFRLKEIDKKLENLKKQKINLEEKFKKGEISAKNFELKLKAIKNIESSLNAQRFKLKEDLKESVNNAEDLKYELKKINAKIKVMQKLASFSKKATIFGTAAIAAGEFIKDWAKTPIESFAELEDAQTQLKITLMNSQGEVGKWFNLIDKQAKELGNRLPGTTTDFYKIAIKLKSLGIDSKSITGGVLKSAAYLAVVLKGMGVSYDEAAEATAKFREAMGISNKNLLKFIDLIQRTAYTGVKLQELQYAFSKVGATLKGIGISGYEAARGITPLIGILIKAGFSGESVGTNLGNIITAAMKFKGSKAQIQALRAGVDLQFTDENGKFLGIDNMMKQLEKLKAIKNDALRLKLVQSIFGTGEAANMVNVLIQKGTKGYKDYLKQLEKQADINKKVEASLKTLSAIWEAFTGTLTNIFAIVGQQVAPALKWITEKLNDLADGFTKFAETHPLLTKIISFAIVGFSGAAIAVGTLSLMIGIATRAFGLFVSPVVDAVSWVIKYAKNLKIATAVQKVFNLVVNMNPFTRFITIASLVVTGLVWMYNKFEWFRSSVNSVWKFIKKVFSWSPLGLIISNWSTISNYFFQFWNWLKEKFVAGINFISNIFSQPVQTISNMWSSLANWFNSFWSNLKSGFSKGVSVITNIFLHPINTIQSMWNKLLGWISKKIEWVSSIGNKIKDFFGFGGDEEKKLTLKPVVEKVKPIVTATAVSTTLATAQPTNTLKPITALQSIQPIKPISVPVNTQMQSAKNAQTTAQQTIVYNFNFGDIKVETKDGKIANPEELKEELKRIIEEIDFEKHQRSLSDVV